MVSGVAPGAKVMCLKVQDDDGRLFASYIFAAYQYAMEMGAHIIVNSFSNTYWSVPQNPPGMSTSDCNICSLDRIMDSRGQLINLTRHPEALAQTHNLPGLQFTL